MTIVFFRIIFVGTCMAILLAVTESHAHTAQDAPPGPAWATDAIDGYWSGNLIRMDSAMRINVRFTRDADGALQCSSEYPDWIWYGWGDPTPVQVNDDDTILLRARYGDAELVVDRDYREMIGAVGATTPATTLHLRRSVEPPHIAITEEVITCASDVNLEGTLVLPEGDGPHACVLLLHPRGCYSRDSALLKARALARYGVAAFAFDQRGMGASEGSCETATFGSTVDDAAAALRALADHPHLDATRIGALGESAGAWTTQGLTARALDDATLPELAFIITWVGPATSIEQQQRDSAMAIAQRLGMSDEHAQLVQRHVTLQLDDTLPSAQVIAELKDIERSSREAGWMDSMFEASDFPSDERGLEGMWLRRFQFDPTDVLRSLHSTPYLGVFGEEDSVVPVDINTSSLRTLLEEAGNTHVRIVRISGTPHALEHGDVIRILPDRTVPTSYYAFDRVEPRFFESTIAFLRELGMTTR